MIATYIDIINFGGPTVDVGNPAFTSWGLVVSPIIYRVLAPSQVVLWDFSQGKGVTWPHPERSFTLWIYPATHQGNSHHQDDLTFLISKSQPKPFICHDCILGGRQIDPNYTSVDCHDVGGGHSPRKRMADINITLLGWFVWWKVLWILPNC